MVHTRTGRTTRPVVRALLTLLTLGLTVVVAAGICLAVWTASGHRLGRHSVHHAMVAFGRWTGVRNAVIRNSTESTRAFVVCEEWSGLGCEHAADWARRELAPGQDTRSALGWSDADGLLIQAGCTMQITGDPRSTPVPGPRWFKIGGFFGVEQELTYTCTS